MGEREFVYVCVNTLETKKCVFACVRVCVCACVCYGSKKRERDRTQAVDNSGALEQVSSLSQFLVSLLHLFVYIF